MPETYLKVDSAYPEDQGAGKARLDPDTMLQLRLNPGDLVAVEGKRRTVAKVWRAMVNDWHQGKVRIDNFTRLNAGASIGDRIKIRALDEEVEAKRVVLAPPEDLPKQLPINRGSVVNKLIDFPVVKNDSVPIQAGLPFMQPQLVAFKAVVVEPENAVIITKNTKIEFSEKPAAGFEGVKRISYEVVGGLKDELQRVRETIELPMRHPEIFRTLGIEPPKGVLLYGPPGTGKTLIAKAVASESGAHFISIAGPEVISKYYGESEQRLRDIFEEARQNAPAIIFIDELDSIAPRREEVTGEVERRVVAQLLTMMDGLEERGQVVVIGATNRIDAIDPALRRGGRFDREIEIGVPNEDDRKEVLEVHTKGMPLEGTVLIHLKEKELNEIKLRKENIENELLSATKKADLENQGIIGAESSLTEIRGMQSKNDDELERIANQLKLDGITTESDKRKLLEQHNHLVEKGRELAKKRERVVLEKEAHEKAKNEAQKEIAELKPTYENASEELEKTNKEFIRTQEDVKDKQTVFYAEVSRRSKGFVGADLAALAREAAIKALRRYIPEFDTEAEEIPPEVLENMEVLFNDFWEALREISPSAMREILLEIPHVSWDDIGGLESAKLEIKEAVEYPLTRRKRFENLGIEPPKGVLLYGPPGTGKTLIAKAIANESGANFIPVRGPQLLSKWVGESERAVREVFKKARQVAPSIIFFDELDALATARGSGSESHVIESVLNQILTEIDGLEELRGVVVMGATNRPDMVDPALLRPGRFDRLVYIGEPGQEGREKILAIHTRYMPIEGSTMEELVTITENLSENELKDLIRSIGINYRRKVFGDLANYMPTLRDFTIKDLAESTEGFTKTEFEDLLRAIGTNDQEDIRKTQTRFRSIKDSTVEDLVKLTERLTESRLSDLILTVRTNSRVDIQDMKDQLARNRPAAIAASKDEGFLREPRRRKLVDLLDEQNIFLDDPERDRLLKKVATGTEGFVGSDLEALAREAAMLAMREGVAVVKPSHFENAREKVHATMNERLRQYYEKVQQHFKGGLPKDIQPPEYQ